LNLCYKYKLLPSKSQKSLLNSHFFAFNQAWNITLSYHIDTRNKNSLIKQDCPDYKATYLSNTDLDREIKRILNDREVPFNSKIVQQARMLCNQAIQTNYKIQKKRMAKDLEAKYSDISYRVSSSPKQVIETTKEQYNIINDIHSTNGIGLHDNGECRIKNGILRLFRENFKFIKHRAIPENYEIKNLKISKDGDSYYVIFSCSSPLPTQGQITPHFISTPNSLELVGVGIDFNLDSLDLANETFHDKLKFSDLKKIIQNQVSIKRLERTQERISLLMRKQSRRVLKAIEKSKANKVKVRDCLSKNFLKTQQIINKRYKKIRNYRNDYLHKFVNSLLENLLARGVNHIVVEKLDIKQMTSKENVVKIMGKARSKAMRKNILALAPSQLYDILEYKCTIRELYFSKVDPAQSEQAFACKKEHKSSNRMQQALLVKKLVVLVELLNKH
jgi:IS605 OrfB family transposase